MTYSKNDIITKTKEEGVKFISLQFTDMFGHLKNVAITPNQLERALNNEIMFDGSSIRGFARIEESDMYLHPDFDTFTILPWKSEHGKTARLICDVYKPDGTPFTGDPRYVLRKALKKAKDMGYTLNVGSECEFFMFSLDENGNATTNAIDNAGYFELGPLDKGESTRRDIALTLANMDFKVEASHHECGKSQHEIDFEYDEALASADKISTFKLVVKTIARENNMHATFMPKPIFGDAGNGMHLNLSLSKDGNNAFYDETDDNGLSQLAYSFIAGVLEHIKSITAITNPLVNSYKRLTSGFEAPCYIAWANSNRSPLIRVPSSRGAGTRVELRNPDPSANPYLAIACCLMAGLDGIERNLKAPAPLDKNIYQLSKDDRKSIGVDKLPQDLNEAISYMKKSPFAKEVLGEHVFNTIIKAKEAEYKEYSNQVTKWELDKYLNKY